MALNRDDVLAAALELLDAEGLDRLTVRRLATRLGVQHGALYWHFADKQALLDAVAERLLVGVADIDLTAPPLSQLAEIAYRFRAALLSHRDGARVVAGTFVREPSTLRAGNAGVRAALAVGAPPKEAALLSFSLQEYVLGHTIEEQSREHLIADGTWEQRVTEPIDAELYPELSEVFGLLDGAARAPEGFAYGLGLMLDGIRLRYADAGVVGPD